MANDFEWDFIDWLWIYGIRKKVNTKKGRQLNNISLRSYSSLHLNYFAREVEKWRGKTSPNSQNIFFFLFLFLVLSAPLKASKLSSLIQLYWMLPSFFKFAFTWMFLLCKKQKQIICYFDFILSLFNSLINQSGLLFCLFFTTYFVASLFY